MRICILAALVLSLAACSKTETYENSDGAITVQVPVTDGENYRLDPVQLLTVTSLKAISGLAAKFFIEPEVRNGELTGKAPVFRYVRNSNGVVIPKDSLSLQLASVYMHMERLKALDEAAGVASVNTWPRKVAVNAYYSQGADGPLYNNALYSGQIDAMVFVPYTQSNLPVMVNAGVLGHEHFHSLFYKLVILPLGDKYPGVKTSTIHDEASHLEDLGVKKSEATEGETPGAVNRDAYHAVLLRAMNEGLADVWGWIYSGDVDFVRKSIPQEKITRNLDYPIQGNISSTAEVKAYVSLSTQTMGLSYMLGNQYARAIKMITETIAEKKAIDVKQVRQETALLIAAALPALKDKVQNLKEDEFLTTSSLLEIFSEQLSAKNELNASICGQIIKLTPKAEEANLVTCQKVIAVP